MSVLYRFSSTGQSVTGLHSNLTSCLINVRHKDSGQVGEAGKGTVVLFTAVLTVVIIGTCFADVPHQ